MGDCLKHKKVVVGISDMKVLAEMIGDLHYETLSHLFAFLSEKLNKDAGEDFKGGREKLSEKLDAASLKSYEVSLIIRKAWQISKPFMSNSEQDLEVSDTTM